MLLAPAWQGLTVKQQQLYLYCKAQLYAEHPKPKTEKHPDGNERYFTMNRGKYVKYGLYKDNNQAAFQRDMEALIQAGFITCIEHAYQKNTIYAFSCNWQKDDFEPTVDDMTYSMTKKFRNKRI